MRIALVGFTNSYNDLRWLEMAEAWAAKHDPAMATAWPTARRPVFDLRGPNGQNFLDDKGEYDVVVLFAIYNPSAGNADLDGTRAQSRGQTSLARNHSRENWAARLSRSNAKYLFIFRRPDSVSGAWLGAIQNYTTMPEQPGEFGVSVYSRL